MGLAASILNRPVFGAGKSRATFQPDMGCPHFQPKPCHLRVFLWPQQIDPSVTFWGSKGTLEKAFPVFDGLKPGPSCFDLKRTFAQGWVSWMGNLRELPAWTATGREIMSANTSERVVFLQVIRFLMVIASPPSHFDRAKSERVLGSAQRGCGKACKRLHNLGLGAGFVSGGPQGCVSLGTPKNGGLHRSIRVSPRRRSILADAHVLKEGSCARNLPPRAVYALQYTLFPALREINFEMRLRQDNSLKIYTMGGHYSCPPIA